MVGNLILRIVKKYYKKIVVKQAAMIAHEAIFSNHGQSCIAASRTFVHEKIYDEFVVNAKELAKNRKVGNQYEDVAQGPQVDEEMYTKVMNYIDSGKKEGAKVQVGGSCIGKSGFFIEPTVFSDVTDDMKICREEVCGKITIFLMFLLSHITNRFLVLCNRF